MTNSTNSTFKLTSKQVHDILNDQYIDQKIQQCESMLDDIDSENEADFFKKVNDELSKWEELKYQLEEHNNYSE